MRTARKVRDVNQGTQDIQDIQENRAIEGVAIRATSLALERQLEIEAEKAADELEALLDREELQEWQVVFAFARKLQAIPGTLDLPLTSRKLKKAVTIFCAKMAENYGQFVDFSDTNERWFEFLDAWEKIRFPEGEGYLTVAFKFAEEKKIHVRPDLGEDFSLLASVAYHLQKIQGEEPILLPVDPLAALMDRTPMHISRLIGRLRRFGFIKDVDGNYSYKDHKAKTYRFVKRFHG